MNNLLNFITRKLENKKNNWINLNVNNEFTQTINIPKTDTYFNLASTFNNFSINNIEFKINKNLNNILSSILYAISNLFKLQTNQLKLEYINTLKKYLANNLDNFYYKFGYNKNKKIKKEYLVKNLLYEKNLNEMSIIYLLDYFNLNLLIYENNNLSFWNNKRNDNILTILLFKSDNKFYYIESDKYFNPILPSNLNKILNENTDDNINNITTNNDDINIDNITNNNIDNITTNNNIDNITTNNNIDNITNNNNNNTTPNKNNEKIKLKKITNYKLLDLQNLAEIYKIKTTKKGKTKTINKTKNELYTILKEIL